MKLLEHPFIQSISELRRDALLDEIEILKLKLSDIIFRQNSSSDALYLIFEESVSFNKRKQDGSNQPIITSDEDSFFWRSGRLYSKTTVPTKGDCKNRWCHRSSTRNDRKKIIEDTKQ